MISISAQGVLQTTLLILPKLILDIITLDFASEMFALQEGVLANIKINTASLMELCKEVKTISVVSPYFSAVKRATFDESFVVGKLWKGAYLVPSPDISNRNPMTPISLKIVNMMQNNKVIVELIEEKIVIILERDSGSEYKAVTPNRIFCELNLELYDKLMIGTFKPMGQFPTRSECVIYFKPV